MIQITGVFGEKTFEKPTAVSALEIAQRFGLQLPTKQKALRFSLNPALVKTVVIEGDPQINMPKSITTPTSMQVTHENGDSFSIKFVQRKPGSLGASRIQFTGGTQLFGMNKLEEAVYWQLSQVCRESPFRDSQSGWKIYLEDLEVKNTAAVEKQARIL